MLSKKYLNLWLLKIKNIEKIGHVHNLFMYDDNEDLSVVSRTTLNERQVHLCQVYVARIIGGWGGGTTYKTVKFSLQTLAVFLIRVASLLSRATVLRTPRLNSSLHSSKISSDTNSLSLMLNNPIGTKNKAEIHLISFGKMLTLN